MVAIPGNFRNGLPQAEGKDLPKPMQWPHAEGKERAKGWHCHPSGCGEAPKPAAQHHAAATKAQAIAKTNSGANQAVLALDGLSSLLAAQAMSDESLNTEFETGYSETYELYGHPDHFQALLALLDRPVGMGVVRRSRTVQVLQPDGTYATEIRTEAQYYQRAYTGDELQYLDRQDRLRGKRRARLGEMDFTLAQPPQQGQRSVTPHLEVR